MFSTCRSRQRAAERGMELDVSIISTSSGREVRLGRLCVENLWADVLEGDNPEFHARFVRPSLLRRVQRGLGITESVLILDNAEPFLPPFLCMAYLQSSAVTPGKFYSYVYVAWFVEDINTSPRLLVQEVLKRFEWESHAQEVSVDEI